MVDLDQDNLNEIISKEENVIVQFGASWCGMCKVIKPKFSKLSQENDGVKFYYVDAEKFPESRNLATIENLPTFAGFKNGKLVKTKASSNEAAIKEVLNEITSN
jgi:thiol-disulfide isomerase/thioredoxin